MPSKNNPKTIIKIGEGSSVCQDGSKGNLSTQVQMSQDAYDANQISAENPFETYLGDEVQSHLDDLASQVKIKPPRLGEGEKTYTSENTSYTISGIPDWGVLKQADSAPWDRNTTIDFDGVTVNSTDFRNSGSETYPYLSTNPKPFGILGADLRSDAVFNVDDDTDLLLGGGDGASFISSMRVTTGEDFRHTRTTYTNATNTTEDGFTISGFLFPADRGTVALLHWATDVQYISAASVTDISNRVIGAINLGEGRLKEEEYLSVFIEGSDQNVFPSKMAGQYDLREMQNLAKRSDLEGAGGAISLSGYAADNNLGAVRLLKDPSACFFGVDNTTVDARGNIPVLFGAYSYDSGTSSWVGNNTNFLAYRLPALVDYTPTGLKTPNEHRERFFQVIQPASTSTDFSTAGNYVTFGDDYYTYQVARYRHVVKYSDIGLNVEGKGSFALVHFKNESAFEKLVRDGIAPTEDDLWSVNFLKPKVGDHIDNLVVDGDAYTELGIPVLGAKNKDSITNPIIRPNVFVRNRDVDESVNSATVGEFSHETFQNSTETAFDPTQGYYTSISGCKYLLPTRDKKDKSSTLLNSAETHHKILNKVSLLSLTNGDLDATIPRYFSKDTTVTKKYNEPFNPFFFNLSSYTAEDEVQVEIFVGDDSTHKDLTPTTQSVSFGWSDIRNDTTTGVVPANFSYFVFYFVPKGDIGLCTFTTSGNTCLIAKDPLFHHDGLAISHTRKPTYTINTQNDGHRTQNLMYHSARLISLVENVVSSSVFLHCKYGATDRNDDQAFAVFRYDQEGFRVYQTLTLSAGTGLELCSTIAKVGVGNFPDYPIYRPLNESVHNPNIEGSHDATLLLVPNEQYFIEAQPDFANSDIYLAFVGSGDYTDTASYDAHLVTSFGVNTYQTSVDFSNRVAGYGLSETNIKSSGVTEYPIPVGNQLDHYPWKVALMHRGYDLHEAPRVNGSELPTYGNFLQYPSGIIGVLGSGGYKKATGGLNVFHGSAVQNQIPLSSLFTSKKDTQERFLDESYRINVTFKSMTGEENLMGDGLPLGSSANLISVRDDGAYGVNNHGEAGYLREGHHWEWCQELNLTVYTDGNGDDYYKSGEAQVRGLPSFSDMVLSGASYGNPRRGLLVRPQTDYNGTSYFPNNSYDASWKLDLATIPQSYSHQADYTADLATKITGRTFSYSRAFDVDFSRSGTKENMVGTSRFKLRILGLDISDFSHSTSDRGIIISAKIPGLTTWLDVGRPNGSGVSKQHISLDGAGCLISYQEGVLIKEGLICVDLLLEMGNLATFIKNSSDECPVLVKVDFLDNAKALDLDFGESGDTKIPLRERKGLVGLEILRMSNGLNIDEDVVV